MDLKFVGNKTAEKRQNFAGYVIPVGAEWSKIGAEIGRIGPLFGRILNENWPNPAKLIWQPCSQLVKKKNSQKSEQ